MIDQWAVPKKSEASWLTNSETDLFIYSGVSLLALHIEPSASLWAHGFASGKILQVIKVI